MKGIKNNLNNRKQIVLFLMTLMMLLFVQAQPCWSGVIPYVSDANTILLDHLDSSTTATINAYSQNGQSCGSALPAATPSYSYRSGPHGLAQGLTLNPPAGQPTGSTTYLEYPGGELLSQSNGTLEFWVYLTSYPTNLVSQGQYFGACAGWTFGMGVDAAGQLSASSWAAFSMNSGTTSVPLNTWTHVAATWGSSGAKLYINGVQVGSDANTGHPATGFGGSLLIPLGLYAGTSIDELRVSNIQRTTFNVDTSPGIPSYVSDANTILLDHLDSSTTATINAYSQNGQSCGSALPAATPSYSYRSGPHGLAQGLTLNPPAGQPTGSTTYLEYPGGELLSQSNGTLEFWVYLTSYPTNLVSQGQYFGACAGWTFGMGVDAAGQLSASSWAAFSMNSGTTSVPLNTWTHVAATWGSSGAKLYINGVQVGSDANTGHPATGFGGSLLIPLGLYAGTSIDELRVSNIQRTTFNVDTSPGIPSYVSDANTILLDHLDSSTTATINAYSQNGQSCGSALPAATPSYSYRSGPHGLAQGLTLNPPAGQPTGSTTYLEYPGGELLSQSNGTLEFWVYLTSYPTNLVSQGQYFGACAGWTFGMGVDAAGQLSASSWAAFSMNSGTTSVPLNTWTHVAATWGSSGAKLYINGVQVGSDANTGHPATGFGGSLLIPLGLYAGTSIDELRVSNIQRTTFNTFDTITSTLYANFTGGGVWMYSGTSWSQVTPGNPTSMVAAGSLLYGNFTGGGVWMYSGTSWSQVTPGNPTSMVAAGSLLYGNFTGGGVWMYNGTSWSQVTPGNPTSMVAAGSLLYGNFTGGGVWMYNGTSWSQVNAVAPTSMVASGSLLYGNFGAGGLWQWNGTTWSMVNAVGPNNMVASSSILYGDFGAGGLWQWNGTTWSMVNAVGPNNMVASSSILYGDFGAGGLWQWDGTVWSQVNAVAPASMVTGP